MAKPKTCRIKRLSVEGFQSRPASKRTYTAIPCFSSVVRANAQDSWAEVLVEGSGLSFILAFLVRGRALKFISPQP